MKKDKSSSFSNWYVEEPAIEGISQYHSTGAAWIEYPLLLLTSRNSLRNKAWFKRTNWNVRSPSRLPPYPLSLRLKGLYFTDKHQLEKYYGSVIRMLGTTIASRHLIALDQKACGEASSLLLFNARQIDH